MAWRIADYVTRGEIDNRIKGRVTGEIWIEGLDAPLRLELEGNPYRDLAGQRLRFENPDPKPIPEHLASIAKEQTGVVGDITAARKVKVLDIPDDEFEHYYTNKIPMPYHWANSMYLEWHSARNGRVVIEAAEFMLATEKEPAWEMSHEEEKAQLEANGRAMIDFMNRLVEAANQEAEREAPDEDASQSRAEAEADAEDARMNLLLDRVTARMEREGHEDFDRIMDEERERLRRERGEPEPEPLTEEEEAERAQWIEEMNAAAEAALEAEPDPEWDRTHPLVDHCHDLVCRCRKEIEANQWLPEGASEEHPLRELEYGVMFASAKLVGALNGPRADWPPDEISAGNAIVRLKKARNHLEDSLRGIEAAETERLADPAWLHTTRREVESVLGEVRNFIDEVRDILRRAEGGAE